MVFLFLLKILPVVPSASLAHLESGLQNSSSTKTNPVYSIIKKNRKEIEHALKSVSTNNESPNVLRQFSAGIETGDSFSGQKHFLHGKFKKI